MNMANDEKLYGLDYVDDVVCLFESMEAVRRALNKLARVVARLGMCLTPSKCKVLF